VLVAIAIYVVCLAIWGVQIQGLGFALGVAVGLILAAKPWWCLVLASGNCGAIGLTLDGLLYWGFATQRYPPGTLPKYPDLSPFAELFIAICIYFIGGFIFGALVGAIAAILRTLGPAVWSALKLRW